MTAHASSGPILEVFPVLFWSWMTNLYELLRLSSGSRGGPGGAMAPQNFCHIIIHGIITPVMLLTTVCVASHCRYLCLHVYSASEGTSVARTTLV